MPHSERAGSCCSEGCVGWVYRFSPGASTVPALDKLSLTERNLQQVVSRSDLNLEQRLEGHRFTSQAEVARFRNLTDFSAYRTNSPESVIVCKRRVKTGMVEAPGENRYTYPTHPSEQHEPARSE